MYGACANGKEATLDLIPYPCIKAGDVKTEARAGVYWVEIDYLGYYLNGLGNSIFRQIVKDFFC